MPPAEANKTDNSKIGDGRALAAPKLVRRCLFGYIGLLIFFWIVAVSVIHAKISRQGEHFSVFSLSYLEGHGLLSDFTDFDPIKERIGRSVYKGALIYPPAAELIYLVFTRTYNQKPVHGFVYAVTAVFCLVGLALAIAVYQFRNNRLLLISSVFLTIALGYPFFFLLERANVEGGLYPFTAAAIVAFILRRHFTAAILISVATAMKIFPVVLLALLFARKRYKEMVLSLALILPIEAVSLWMIGPTFSKALADIRHGMGLLSRYGFWGYGDYESVGYDHSLFSIPKQLLHLSLSGEALNLKIAGIGPWYGAVAAGSVAALWFFRLRSSPILNQAMVLVLISVTLPFVSIEYTLVHVFLAWGMFLMYLGHDVAEGKSRLKPAALLAILGLFAFLFTPQQYIRVGPDIYSGQVKSVALLALITVVMLTPMKSSLFDSPSGTATKAV